jgi:multidrug resistance efflux pump
VSLYAEAAAAADPGVVLAASDVPSAQALLGRFWAIAEDLPSAGADPATYSDTLNMVDAEGWVVEAARAVAIAEAELAAAQAAAAAAETDQECAAAEADIADAQAALAEARARLEQALHDAAATAAVMNRNLHARHGGIHEAVTTTTAPAARRGFYIHDSGNTPAGGKAG